jgi:hypothetical protein
VNARKVIAADLGIESSRVVIGRFTGGWLPDDVTRPRRLPREEHSLVLIEPWAGLTEAESPVERP